MSAFSKLIVCAYEKRRLCRDCAHAGISCAGPYSVKMEDQVSLCIARVSNDEGPEIPDFSEII